MSIRVLALGEIVGSSGVYTIKKLLPELREEKNIDLVIANGEGATGGFGLGKRHALYMKKLGLDIITIGEKGFFKKDMVQFIRSAKFMLRPANYPPGTPGFGWKTLTIKDKKVTVICMLGMSGFNRVHLSNPFSYITQIIKKLSEETDIFIVDFHACTTAEKYTMFHILNGKAAVVYGTHSKALTADCSIMDKGTGIICDTGRCGSLNSVGGLQPDIEIEKFLTQVPKRSKDCFNELEIQGALFEIDDSGKCISAETLRMKCPPPEQNNNQDNN